MLRDYLSSAIHKLGAKNRIEAIRIAEQSGWLKPPSYPTNRYAALCKWR